MKTYKIPVAWRQYGVVYMEAETVEEARKMAVEDKHVPLPDEYHCADASWQVENLEIIKLLNK